ncbi:MAG: anti-sigma factor antagonist [Candidatus Wallbacteria bacterium]|nr:anti-sigma factor antagonist [Candidatus Wallbacteria bacterium]
MMMETNEQELNRISYNIRTQEGITIFELIGELDMYTLPRAQEIIDMLVEQERFNILMDLAKLEYIDSSGIGFFTATLKLLRDHNGDLKIVKLHPYIKRLFDLIHLDFFISIYESYEEATSDFKDNISRAIMKWKKVVEIKPNYADAYYHLGLAYVNKSMFEEARDEFQRALDINPNYADAHKRLGDVLKQLGKVKEAGEKYKAALKINPKYSDALIALGLLYNDDSMLDDAICHYRKALDVHPNYADVLNKLGAALKGKKDYNEAVKSFKSALKINPGFIDALRNLAHAYEEMEEPENAIKELTTLVKFLNNDEDKDKVRAEIRKLKKDLK